MIRRILITLALLCAAHSASAQGGGANASALPAPCNPAFGLNYVCSNLFSVFAIAPQVGVTAGALQVGAPTGGNTGNGTINTQGAIYENNVDIHHAPGSVGQILYNPGGNWSAFTLGGDCTLSVPAIICTKSNGSFFGSAAFVATGSSGHVLPFLDIADFWSAAQSFQEILNAENDQPGTTYTLQASDCGKVVAFSNGAAVTVTVPAAIVPSAGTVCDIKVRQDGAGQVALNGSAVTPATLVSAHSFTKTFGQHAIVELQLTTISSTSTAILTGDGA